MIAGMLSRGLTGAQFEGPVLSPALLTPPSELLRLTSSSQLSPSLRGLRALAEDRRVKLARLTALHFLTANLTAIAANQGGQ